MGIFGYPEGLCYSDAKFVAFGYVRIFWIMLFLSFLAELVS